MLSFNDFMTTINIGKKTKMFADNKPPAVNDKYNNLYDHSKIPKEDNWKKILSESLSSPKEISKIFSINYEDVKSICKNYPARINPYYLSLIKEKNDPIYKQAIPSIEEINDNVCIEDPLHEEPENQSRKNVPSLLTHRYPDRILFRVSN